MATYNSRAEFEDEANRKKAKELTAKLEAQERANKAQAEIDKKRNAQELRGDDRLPTDPIDDFVIPGCMDPAANNYNPQANIDDGSCDYGIIVVGLSVPGCMDPLATNYNPLATVDDGSCEYCIYGCMNPNAQNYDPLATCDDGSCIRNGCMDPYATNYDPLALQPSNKCLWEGCTDNIASNYVGLPPTAGFSLFPVAGVAWDWESAITGDGGFVNPVVRCRYDKIRGCMDPLAINYDPLATVSSNSCRWLGCKDPNAANYVGLPPPDGFSLIPTIGQTYNWQSTITGDGGDVFSIPCKYETIKGCTDPNAVNYDPLATVDDGSCDYLGCTNTDADNYDPDATIDDGSCEWYGCTDPLADNYSFPGSSVDGPNGIFTYLTGNAVDDGSCLYDNPRDPCYQIGDITDPANGGGGGMVFALPNTTSNPTPYYFEVSLEDLSTGGNPLDHHYDVISNPVATLDDINITCGEPSVEAPIHTFNSPWFESIDISIPNNQFRYGYGVNSFQPTITPPPIGQPTGVNIGDPVEAVDNNNHPLFTSPTTIIDIELIPAGINTTSTGQLVSTLTFDSYLFTFSQSMVAPPLSQPIKVLTTGGILTGGPFTTSGAEWGAYNEPLTNLLTFFDEGRTNTDQIINYPPAGAEPVWPTHTTAAKLCSDYVTSPASLIDRTLSFTIDVDDWFLPSLDEFDLMYKKLGPGTPHAAALNLTIGVNTSEMMDDVYWTSSDLMDGGPVGAGFYYAWAYSTNPGPWSSSIGTPIPVGPVSVTRCSTLSVRAIRKFQCVEPVIEDPNRYGWVDTVVKPFQSINGNHYRSWYVPGGMGSGFSSFERTWHPGYTPLGDRSRVRFEGVIGGDTFGWQIMTTDSAGNQWDVSDFDDANNPNGYTFRMWSADGTYLGTWRYDHCTLVQRENNWIRQASGITSLNNIPWYNAVPRLDGTGVTSIEFPDKLRLQFAGVTHVDTPLGQVVNYGYSWIRSDGSTTGGNADNTRAQLWRTTDDNGNPITPEWDELYQANPINQWNGLTTNGGFTTYIDGYYNAYMERGWTGETASHAFIQLTSGTSASKPNNQPNVFSGSNNTYQQKHIVCIQNVWEDLRDNIGGAPSSNHFAGGFIGVGYANPLNANIPSPPAVGFSNTVYGSQLVASASGPPQTIDRIYNLLPNASFPKHYFFPWYADFQPSANSLLTWYNSFQDGIDAMNNQTGCVIYDPPEPPRSQTICDGFLALSSQALHSTSLDNDLISYTSIFDYGFSTGVILRTQADLINDINNSGGLPAGYTCILVSEMARTGSKVWIFTTSQDLNASNPNSTTIYDLGEWIVDTVTNPSAPTIVFNRFISGQNWMASGFTLPPSGATGGLGANKLATCFEHSGSFYITILEVSGNIASHFNVFNLMTANGPNPVAARDIIYICDTNSIGNGVTSYAYTSRDPSDPQGNDIVYHKDTVGNDLGQVTIPGTGTSIFSPGIQGVSSGIVCLDGQVWVTGLGVGWASGTNFMVPVDLVNYTVNMAGAFFGNEISDLASHNCSCNCNPIIEAQEPRTYINDIPLFAKIQDAIDWGKQYGLEGYHEHTHEGIVGYMAGESHEQSIKAIEGQVIPETVLRSYQEPQQQIIPPMQQLPPPTPPVQTPTPPSTPMPPPDYSSGSSGGSSGGGY